MFAFLSKNYDIQLGRLAMIEVVSWKVSLRSGHAEISCKGHSAEQHDMSRICAKY
jgi:hypothetical protein